MTRSPTDSFAASTTDRSVTRRAGRLDASCRGRSNAGSFTTRPAAKSGSIRAGRLRRRAFARPPGTRADCLRRGSLARPPGAVTDRPDRQHANDLGISGGGPRAKRGSTGCDRSRSPWAGSTFDQRRRFVAFAAERPVTGSRPLALRAKDGPDVDEAERFSGGVDDAHRPQLGHDVSHRTARRIHVANERDEALLLFIDHNAHAGLRRGLRAREYPDETLGDAASAHKGKPSQPSSNDGDASSHPRRM